MWFLTVIYILTGIAAIFSTGIIVALIIAMYQIQKEYPKSNPLNIYNEFGYTANNVIAKLIRICVPPMTVVGTFIVIFHLFMGTFILLAAIAITAIYGVWYAFEKA